MSNSEMLESADMDKLYKLCIKYLKSRGQKILSMKRERDIWFETIGTKDGKKELLCVKKGNLERKDLEAMPKDTKTMIVPIGEVKVKDELSKFENIELMDTAELIRTIKEMELIKEAPSERSLPSLGEVENILKVANESFGRKDYNRALQLYSKVLSIKSNIASVWAAKGETYRALNDFEAALGCYKKALRLNVKNPKFWYKLGTTLYKLGRHEEEIESYDMAIKNNPEYIEAWNHKGIAFFILGKYEEAMLCYDVVLRKDPNNILGWNNKGLALRKMKKAEQAIKCFNKALELKPDFMDALLNKAMLLYNSKDYRSATEEFEKILKIKESAQILYYLGMAHIKLENYEEARKALIKASAELPHAIKALGKMESDIKKRELEEKIRKMDAESAKPYGHLQGLLMDVSPEPDEKKEKGPKRPKIDKKNYPCFGEYEEADEGCKKCKIKSECERESK